MKVQSMLLIFDVDGTLTPSRGRIDEEFRKWMLADLAHPFILVTGSDPDKTREQIGDELYNKTTVYNCAGNHIFKNGHEFYRSSWVIPNNLQQFLEEQVTNSEWSDKTGKHIEHRVGLCNFSIVGRNASVPQRKAYYQYDQATGERLRIASEIMKQWPAIDAGVAGETGIDIYAKGNGKSQVLDFEGTENTFYFFGDRMDPAGNDYPLATAILQNKLGNCYHVKDWQETWHRLKGMQ